MKGHVRGAPFLDSAESEVLSQAVHQISLVEVHRKDQKVDRAPAVFLVAAVAVERNVVLGADVGGVLGADLAETLLTVVKAAMTVMESVVEVYVHGAEDA